MTFERISEPLTRVIETIVKGQVGMTQDKTWLEAVYDCDGVQDLLIDMLEHAVGHATADKSVKYASPIELAMATAMCVVRKVNYPEFGFYPTQNLTKAEAAKVLETMQSAGSPDRTLGCIFPQVAIGPYRVDFLVLHSGGGVVIECDGHAFHEKTKEQAAKDKARDRSLQERGYKTFHYTGSEIWRDAIRCAREVLSKAHSDAVDAEHVRFIQTEGQFADASRVPF